MRKKEKEGDPNIYSTKKLLSFPTKFNNNNKKIKHLECNCWVCKILDSKTDIELSRLVATIQKSADTLQYESYNIISETGDSIYAPQYEEFTTFDDIGQVFVSEKAIEEIVNRIIDQKRLGSS